MRLLELELCLVAFSDILVGENPPSGAPANPEGGGIALIDAPIDQLEDIVSFGFELAFHQLIDTVHEFLWVFEPGADNAETICRREGNHILRQAPQAVYDEIARRVTVDRRIVDARMVVQVWVEHVCRVHRAKPDDKLKELIRRYNP